MGDSKTGVGIVAGPALAMPFLSLGVVVTIVLSAESVLLRVSFEKLSVQLVNLQGAPRRGR